MLPSSSRSAQARDLLPLHITYRRARATQWGAAPEAAISRLRRSLVCQHFLGCAPQHAHAGLLQQEDEPFVELRVHSRSELRSLASISFMQVASSRVEVRHVVEGGCAWFAIPCSSWVFMRLACIARLMSAHLTYKEPWLHQAARPATARMEEPGMCASGQQAGEAAMLSAGVSVYIYIYIGTER